MLTRQYSFQTQLGDRENPWERWLVPGMLALYVILSYVWGFASDATWDDDCPTRYYNTLNAFSDPKQFVSVWNRPLFVVLFALPVQISHHTILLLMPLITGLGAWMLYRALRKLKIPNAWTVIPFFLFQTFLFSTSRDALTEPLAAALIAMGFWALTQKRWLLYAVIGGLLPLARLELSLLLIFWVIPMIREKQWRSMVMLVFPLILWNIAAAAITGDAAFVLNKTVGAGGGENRYGQQPFSHYFWRYMYITGPVAFFFAGVGLWMAAVRKKLNLWIYGQFAGGFMLYVIFSWQLSLGNAAGFLRNLVPLSPLVALMAVEGFNAFSEAIFGKTKDKTYRQQVMVASGTAVAVAGLFYSNYLDFHHVIVDYPDLSRVTASGIIALSGLGMYFAYRKRKAGFAAMNSLGMGVTVLGMAYTLWQEPPDMNMNAERATVGKVSDIYLASTLDENPTYVNHIWFFWANGLNKWDDKYKTITQENLNQAPLNSVVIWENHYSYRLGGDVGREYMDAHPEFVDLYRLESPDKKFSVVIYQKGQRNLEAGLTLSDRFMNEFGQLPGTWSARANYRMRMQDFQGAIKDFEQAITMDKRNHELFFGLGYAHFLLKQLDKAIPNFRKAVEINPRFASGWYNLAVSQANLQDFPAAISAMTKALDLNPDRVESWYTRGMFYTKTQQFDLALMDFTKALSIDPNALPALLNRGVIYAFMNRNPEAMVDINRVLSLDPENAEAWHQRGRIEIATGQRDAGCQSLKRAADAGHQTAAAFMAGNCQ